MVPSNNSFFQYCDSNIGLISIAIAPCKVMTFIHLCIFFGISFFLFYGSFSKVIALPTIALKGESEKIIITFR